MRAATVLVVLVAALLSVTAQYQPETPIDTSLYAQREDLAPAGSLDGAQRIVRFVQVSDAHVLDDDAPYPLRQEILDDYITAFSTSAQRPQEEYTDEVLDAIIRSINSIHAADDLDFVINTGDNIDNELENELMRFIDNWEGTTTTVGPVSGKSCAPDGQSTGLEDMDHDEADTCTSLPEGLAANNTPLTVGLPWYSAFGNHDGLIQGNVPNEPSFDQIADQFGRYLVSQPEYVDMHFAGGMCPGGVPGGTTDDDFGHGYGFAGDRLCDQDPDNDGYYAFSLRGVRFLVLDTVNDDFAGSSGLQGIVPGTQTTIGNDIIGGYAEGSIDPVQHAWMLADIDAHADAPVILFSHHTVNSMFTEPAEGQCGGGQCLQDALEEAGYATGAQLIEELAQRPNVLAWVGGHTHRHRIEAKGTADGGFWNIESSSLIDMPQEARVIELWATPEGKAFLKLDDFGHDFETSRALAADDPQRDGTAEGEAKDQDVLLWLDLPAGMAFTPQPSLPRELLLRNVGGTAKAGEDYLVQIRAEDPVRSTFVDGLSLTVALSHTDTVGSVTDLAAGTVLDPLGNGTYGVHLVPSKGTTHFAKVTATDPDGTYPDTSQVISINVDGPPVSGGKRTPATPTVLVALAVLAVVVRQNR